MLYGGLEPFTSKQDPKFKDIKGTIYGKVMNIYTNINFVLDLLNQVDKNGNVFFMGFLRNLCNSLNVSLGGVNKLEPKIDPDTNLVKIVDQTPLPKRDKLPSEVFFTGSSQEAVFDLYGYNLKNTVQDDKITSNFIHNVGLTTEITPGYAEMITIGATADGYVVGEESTAFSKWNTGIVDRFKTEVVTNTATKIQQLQTQIQQTKTLIEKYKEVRKNYIELLNVNDPSELNNRFLYAGIQFGTTKNNNPTVRMSPLENIETSLSNISEYYKLIQAASSERLKKKNAKKPLKSSGQTGFLPFNLKLDMDGISGIKIYNKLRVNTKFLPSNYPETMEFLATNVDHELRDNKWVTKINSIATVSNLLNTDEIYDTLYEDYKINLTTLPPPPPSVSSTVRKEYKIGQSVIASPSTNPNPIIIRNANQKAKYLSLFSSKLPPNFDNFVIRKGDDPTANNGKGSYALQFKNLVNTPANKGFIKIKRDYSREKNITGQLGNGADITKELYDALVLLLTVAKAKQSTYQSILPLVITAGNDAFHQGGTLPINGKKPKYPTKSSPNITPANTTHTRGLAIDLKSFTKSKKIKGKKTIIPDIARDNLIIELVREAGFVDIFYHGPPHIHANLRTIPLTTNVNFSPLNKI